VVLFCAYADSDCYSLFVDNTAEKDDGLFFKFIKNALRDGITVQSYQKRAEILISFPEFSTSKMGETIRVNAACTMFFLNQKLFLKYPVYKEVSTCDECRQSSRRSGTLLEITLPTLNLTSLKDMITNFATFPAKCRKCDSIVQRDCSFFDHIFLEIFTPYMENNLRQRMEIPLKDIPQEIEVAEKTYTIRGVIPFQPPDSNDQNAVGHYTAYCWRSRLQRWQLFDDLIKKNSMNTGSYVKSRTVVDCDFLLYTL